MIESKIATHLLVTGGFLFVLLIAFLAMFLVPGVLHWRRLRRILSGIEVFKIKTPPSEFKKLFANDKPLTQLWAEYQDTLHVQREEHDGQMQVAGVRSTVGAETYFNEQFVVDSRLHTEFFKHLPGIFTGLGIIGTFTGLIDGLHHFQVSENAATVRASLESLMHAVGEAFFVSAAAIGAAMFVTFCEKLLLTTLYRKTEAIAHAIDARFEAGAGEEYLSRLVSASEASASQAKILKDALVKELGDILRKLTISHLSKSQQFHAQLAERIEASSQQQVAAAQADTQHLGDVIAGSIERSLKGPLDKIADSVEVASGDQSANAATMLNDIMISFSQRLNDLFGGQISGINELNKQTAQGMQDAVASLSTLVGRLEENGKRATNDMATQMASSMKAMEDRQDHINTQTKEIIDAIRQSVQASQTETQQGLQGTLDAIGQQMGTMLTKLNESQIRVFEDNRVREQFMADRTSNVLSEVVGSVSSLVGKLEESGRKTTEDMAIQMASSMKAMEDRQARINMQTQEVIDVIRQSAQASQTETQQKLQGTLNAIGQQMGTMLSKLNESQTRVFEDNRAREQSMADRTSNVLSEMAGSVSTLVEKIDETGRKATDNMAMQMASSMKAMEERQIRINAQAQDSIEQIQQSVRASQTETQQTLQGTLGSIGQQMNAMLSKLNESQAKVFEENRAREKAMADRVASIISDITRSVEGAVKKISETSQVMAKSISILTEATTSTVDKMSTGATRLDLAATNFAAAGDRVTGVMSQAAAVSEKLIDLSGSLSSCSGALQEALRDYKFQRDSISTLLSEVRAMIEHAKKEASFTGDVLQRIEASTTKLSQAQRAADEYLDGVSQVLADSSDAFRESVVSTLKGVNYEFLTQLNTAVNLLSGTILELDATIGDRAPRR